MQSRTRESPYCKVPACWNIKELADLCIKPNGIQTGPFGSQLHQADYQLAGTSIITVEHLGDNRILHRDLPLVSDYDRKRLARYTLQRGDIVFSRVGSVDRRALVLPAEDGWLFSGRCLRVRPDTSIIDPGFLSWFFGFVPFQEYIRQIAVGATMPSLNTEILSKVKVIFPPLHEQRAIAHILSTLDDKIELNRKMNETLEAIVRAFFKSWFVDFDPVRAKAEGRQPAGMDAETAALFPDGFEDSELGEIPRGWDVQRLENHLNAERGVSYSGDGLSESSGMPMHNLNSVYEGGGYKFEGIKFYTGEYKERHELHPGDVIVTNTEQGFDYLLIGYPAIIPKHFGETGIYSHHIYRVRPVPGSPLSTYFVYHLLMAPLVREQIVACTNGTTVNMLHIDGLRTPRFILPSAALIQHFESTVSPMFAKVEANYEESLSLAALRDALLPKLISGEIRVKDAEKFLEAKSWRSSMSNKFPSN